MTLLTATHLLTALLVVAVFWFMPVMNHATPFGVNTPTSQLEHPTIPAALRKYRRDILILGAVWIILAAAIRDDKAALIATQITPLVALAVAIGLSHKYSQPIRDAKRAEDWYRDIRTGVVVDVTETKPPSTGQPWGIWVLSLVPLIYATAHCVYHYPTLPDVIPTHYGPDGPDAWSEKSAGSVFGLIFVALGVSAFMLACSYLPSSSLSTTPKGSPAIGLYLKAAKERAAKILLAVMSLALNVMMTIIVVETVPDGELSDTVFGVTLASFMVTTLLVCLWSVRAGQRLPPEIAATAGELEDPDEDHFWKWGVFYVNKDNPNMLVEKRQGFGQTVNFARWEVWLLAAILLLPEPFIIYFATR